MNHSKSPIFLLLLIPFFLGCAPSFDRMARPSTVPSYEKAEKESEFILEKEEQEQGFFLTLVYLPHPKGDPQHVLDFLEQNPKRRLTLVFPPDYFKSDYRKEFVEPFRAHLTSNTIEIGLTLDNEPNLPLLANLDLAGPEVTDWGVSFAWPEDIALQIARGSAAHQKRWNQLPTGLWPPYLSLSKPVVKSLSRFRLYWVAAKAREQRGVAFFGSTPILVPPVLPEPSKASLHPREKLRELATWAVTQPYAVVDGGMWNNRRMEKTFLAELGTVLDNFKGDLLTMQEFSEIVDEDSFELEDRDSLFENDFSGWVVSDQQRRAWGALAKARKVVETYKNSGRANLRRLDAAQEEILTAEGGTFLYGLGQSLVPMTLNEKNFIATISNVYRLCGESIPKNLNRLFSKTRKWTKKNGSKTKTSGPFFDGSDQNLKWNDPKGDDFGAGELTYPVGTYAKGSFDLTTFQVSWTNKNVTITTSLGKLPNKDKNVILPLMDVYIDVNRLAGAGSVNPLPDRGPVLIEREAAWEYAISMGPYGAFLYQPVPGSKPRQIKTFKPQVMPKGNRYALTIPRSLLRGNPSKWRITAGLMGSEVSRALQSSVPSPILVRAGQRNFGGGLVGKKIPRFIDLLAESSDVQIDRLKQYESGRKVTLPYVEVIQ